MTSVYGEVIVSANHACLLENAEARSAFVEEIVLALIVNEGEFVKEKHAKKEAVVLKTPPEAAILESARAEAVSLGPSALAHNARDSLSNLFPVQKALQ